MSGLAGKVLTVQGVIDPDQLGRTLTHEHLYIEAGFFYTPPRGPIGQQLTNVPFELRHLGWIRQNPYSHTPNLTLVDESDAIKEELLFFKENGGATIVENSSEGLAPNRLYLKKLSESTGINLICGTGFYIDTVQTEAVRNYSQEEMAEKIRSDILLGVDSVRCGVIGEVGTSWPLTDFEKRSLQSSALIQEELGCPIIIHPGRDARAPGKILRIVLEAGGRAEHTVMSHLDRTFLDEQTLLEYAKLGSYLEYDLFGTEVSHYQLNEAIDMPSDAQRISLIRRLLQEGYGDKVLLSHDIHTKHRLMKYGGHGFSHILLNVVPKMLQRGISQEQVDQMLQGNPQRWLQFFK